MNFWVLILLTASAFSNSKKIPTKSCTNKIIPKTNSIIQFIINKNSSKSYLKIKFYF